MAQRWAQQKLAADQRRRDAKAGRHDRFHGWTFEETREKAEMEGRSFEPRTPAIDTTQMVAEFLERKTITRAPCKGIMPVGCMGRTMRKARHAPVKLWTGTDGSKGKLAAPPGKGMLVNNWATPAKVWRIVAKP